jgi:hypothetical protein
LGWADGGTKEFVYCGRYMVADFMIEKLPKDQGSFKVIKFLLTPLAADRAAAVAAVAAVGETRFRGATRSKVRRTLRIGPGLPGRSSAPRVSHSRSVLAGAVAWARGALTGPFSAAAGAGSGRRHG